MSHGPNPWLQTNWDLRAALNFICGGAGSGLLVAAALVAGPPQPPLLPLAVGAALMLAGLFSVWLEIGRPLRAVNVYVNAAAGGAGTRPSLIGFRQLGRIRREAAAQNLDGFAAWKTATLDPFGKRG